MTNHQPLLPLQPPREFAPVSPVAANADPPTSHISARTVTESGQRKRNADEVWRAVQRFPGEWTAAELQRLWLRWWHRQPIETRHPVEMDAHEFNRRLADLREAKNGALVVNPRDEHGKEIWRECSVKRRPQHPCMTWRERRSDDPPVREG